MSTLTEVAARYGTPDEAFDDETRDRRSLWYKDPAKVHSTELFSIMSFDFVDDRLVAVALFAKPRYLSKHGVTFPFYSRDGLRDKCGEPTTTRRATGRKYKWTEYYYSVSADVVLVATMGSLDSPFSTPVQMTWMLARDGKPVHDFSSIPAACRGQGCIKTAAIFLRDNRLFLRLAMVDTNGEVLDGSAPDVDNGITIGIRAMTGSGSERTIWIAGDAKRFIQCKTEKTEKTGTDARLCLFVLDTTSVALRSQDRVMIEIPEYGFTGRVRVQ